MQSYILSQTKPFRNKLKIKPFKMKQRPTKHGEALAEAEEHEEDESDSKVSQNINVNKNGSLTIANDHESGEEELIEMLDTGSQGSRDLIA